MSHARFPLLYGVFSVLISSDLWGGVASQNLTVPSSWDASFDASDTRTVREAFASSAATALVNNITSRGSLVDYQDSQTLASLYNCLALQDILSGNATWKDTVLNNMRTWTGSIDIYTNGTNGTQRTNSNAMQWALAFYYAYQAYGDTQFLIQAQSALDTTYSNYITQDVVDGKSTAGRNVTFGQCRSRALGGLFWLPDDATNILIHTYAVGPFAILAGLLYEETRDESYRTLAGQTVAFMGGLNWDTSNNIEYDVYDLGLCDDTKGQAPGLQGWYIYALSIYASIAATNDSALMDQLRGAVASATTPLWTLPNGVLHDTKTNTENGSFDDKAILIRGLSEILRRFPNATDLVQFVEAFLIVQYNAATRNDRNGASYSPDIDSAQAPSSFSDAGNLVALDVLNAAFSINPSPLTKSKSHSGRAPISAIVGGAIGGFVLLVTLTGAMSWWHYKHRRLSSPLLEAFDGDKLIDPNYPPPSLSPDPGSAPSHQTEFAVEPYTYPQTHTSHPMSWPQYNGSLERRQGPYSARQKIALRQSAPSTSMHAPIGHPEPHLIAASTRPTGASSPPILNVGARMSGTVIDGTQDISALVQQLVNDALRQHGTVPPDYDQSSSPPVAHVADA